MSTSTVPLLPAHFLSNTYCRITVRCSQKNGVESEIYGRWLAWNGAVGKPAIGMLIFIDFSYRSPYVRVDEMRGKRTRLNGALLSYLSRVGNQRIGALTVCLVRILTGQGP